MKAVGIRELKARLSHYVRNVERGEVVLVTDRGRVVAELLARRPDGVECGRGCRGGQERFGQEHPPGPGAKRACRAFFKP